MTQVPVQAPPDATLQLDVCATCHLIWVDSGEEAQLPSPRPPPQKSVPAPPKALSLEARQQLAVWKVDELRAAHEETAPPPKLIQRVLAVLDFPVIQNAAAPKEPQLITWGIALLMLLASLWSWNEPFLIREYAFLPSDPWRHAGSTLLTSFFIHGDFEHLIGNGYFLFVFGALVEEFLGSLRFMLLMLAATLLGTLAHVWIDAHPHVPLIGASDGISGLIAFHALLLPHSRLRVFISHRWLGVDGEPPWRWLSIPMGAWAAFWVITQLIGALDQVDGLTHVSSAAHLGGALGGALAWLLWRR